MVFVLLFTSSGNSNEMTDHMKVRDYFMVRVLFCISELNQALPIIKSNTAVELITSPGNWDAAPTDAV